MPQLGLPLLAGGPAELQGGATGICLKQIGQPMPLMKHFLECGRLETGMPAHLASMLAVCERRAVRYGEAKVGTKSRVLLGSVLHCVGFFLLLGC